MYEHRGLSDNSQSELIVTDDSSDAGAM